MATKDARILEQIELCEFSGDGSTRQPVDHSTRSLPRVIRHPMYSAALLFVWATVVSHLLSMLTLPIGVAVAVGVSVWVVAEERSLRAHYAEYYEHVRSTKAVVPWVL